VTAVFASERFHDYFILGLGMHYSQALESRMESLSENPYLL
jgi:hypothetical protein